MYSREAGAKGVQAIRAGLLGAQRVAAEGPEGEKEKVREERSGVLGEAQQAAPMGP